MTPDHASEAVVELPLEAIELDDTFQFRMRLDVAALEADIRDHGQHFPVVVRPRGDLYQLVCGFRRVAALRNLGRPALAVVRELSDSDAMRLSWAENEARASYSDVDRAHGIFKGHEAGYSFRELEDLFAIKKSQLHFLRKLTTLPEVVLEAVRAGTVPTTHAVTLKVLAKRYPQLEYERWVRGISQHGWSLRQLKQRVGLAYDKPRSPLLHLDKAAGKLRLRAVHVDLKRVDAEERALLIGELKQALEALLAEED